MDIKAWMHLTPLSYWFFWEEWTMTWTWVKRLSTSRELKEQKRGTDLFVSVCSTIDDMKLQWNKVTIMDAHAMAGEWSRLPTLVCNQFSEEGGKAIKLHCFIHAEVLCAKHEIWSCYETGDKGYRQFQQFLLDIQAEYGDVVYPNDVRWLSWGSALQRFYSLWEETGQFLAKRGNWCQNYPILFGWLIWDF